MTVSDILNEIQTAFSDPTLSDDFVRKVIYQVIWEFEKKNRLPDNYAVMQVPVYHDTEKQVEVADTSWFVSVEDIPDYIFVERFPAGSSLLPVAMKRMYREIELVMLLPYSGGSSVGVRNIWDYSTAVQSCITGQLSYLRQDSVDFSPIGDLLILKMHNCPMAEAELHRFEAGSVRVAGYLRTLKESSPTLDRYGDTILKECIKQVSLIVKDDRMGRLE